MNRRDLFLALALLSATSLHAAEPAAIVRIDGTTISRGEIDTTVQRLMAAARIPGIGITLLDRGDVVYSRAFGFRDDKQQPFTQDSVMTAASLTKVAFAYLVMQLVDAGRLDLDEPVQEYLPQPLPTYPAYADLQNDARYRSITARMLLSHTSGFPNLRKLNDDRKLNINFEPGTRYAYSGEGMQLLQLVVESIEKQPLQKLMQDRVFRPLGMTRTSMISEERFANDYSSSFDERGLSLGRTDRLSADAAGSMQTSLRDFTTFMRAIVKGKGLSPKTHQLMLSPQIRIFSKQQFPTLSSTTTNANDSIRLSYGLGWGLYWTPYGKAYFKEGHDLGFRHYTVVFEDSGRAIVIMTNGANGEGIYKELLETVLGNRFTPIEWEGFTPYDELPTR
jgi:CubicO group peptidase (beta-lactamase class C family)